MGDRETLKAELRKLSVKAVQAKMDLHDLAEELPINWISIMRVAQEAYDAYAELDRKGRDLKALENTLNGQRNVV
ncbi:CCE_0567 family metalloprotein [Bradyrhizobium centrosematis]|uniref:CCE_0567 family metalloprotein n=1 Tax=Bradyrhizobium centrosematis TaxID=1300039 RepID=UPI003890E54A